MNIDRVTEILTTFDKARGTGYGKKIPGKLDNDFKELAEIYSSATANEAKEIRDRISKDIRLLLLGFGDRFATIAARNGDENSLKIALLAHVIEDFRMDPRENFFRLPVISHVADRMGLNVKKLFKWAALMASEPTAKDLRSFASQRPRERSLDSVGLEEYYDEEEGGISYRTVENWMLPFFGRNK